MQIEKAQLNFAVSVAPDPSDFTVICYVCQLTTYVLVADGYILLKLLYCVKCQLVLALVPQNAEKLRCHRWMVTASSVTTTCEAVFKTRCQDPSCLLNLLRRVAWAPQGIILFFLL